MAEIAEGGGGGHAKGGKKRPKKQSTRIDMTPMVDLAFLLLTFFVLTSTFSKAKVMSLVYPAKPDPKDIKTDQKIFNAMTFIVTEDQLFYYKGAFAGPQGGEDGEPPTQLTEVDFGPQGVRKLLADENKFVINAKVKLDAEAAKTKMADSTYKNKLKEIKQDDKALKVLIKTDEKATCKNFIDLVDELKIANIGVIAPVDITKSEMDLLTPKRK